MTKRIEYLDATKGFAIFLMVFAHVIAWNFSDYSQVVNYSPEQTENLKIAGFLWQVIYSFHMPLFFMISGYLAYRLGGANNVVDALFKKSKRLLIPYLVTGFLILLVRPNFGYWFLFALWELQILSVVISWLMEKLNRKNSLWIDILVILPFYLFVNYVLTLPQLKNPVCNFGQCAGFFIPFFFGFLLRKYEKIRAFTEGKFLLYLMLFICLFVTRYYNGENNIIRLFCRGVSFLNDYSLIAIIGSLLCIELFRMGINKKVETFFSYLGKNTLEIYVLHVFFVFQIKEVGDFWLSTNMPTCLTSQIVYCGIVSIISIGLALALAQFLKRSKLLSSLMFGTK